MGGKGRGGGERKGPGCGGEEECQDTLWQVQKATLMVFKSRPIRIQDTVIERAGSAATWPSTVPNAATVKIKKPHEATVHSESQTSLPDSKHTQKGRGGGPFQVTF